MSKQYFGDYDIVCCDKEEVCIVQEMQMSKEQLQTLFRYENVDVVYVAKDAVIIGVISLGKYSRSVNKKNTRLINKNFRKASSVDDASELLKNVYNFEINEVPVINEKGELECVVKKIVKPSTYDNILENCREIIVGMVENSYEDGDVFYCGENKKYVEFFKTIFGATKNFFWCKKIDNDNCGILESNNKMVIFDTEKEKKQMRICFGVKETKCFSMEFYLKSFMFGSCVADKIISLKQEKEIKVVVARDLSISQIKNATDAEKNRVASGKTTTDYLSGEENLALVESVIGKELFNDDFIHNWLDIGLKREKGIKAYCNYKSRYINYDGCFRHLPSKREIYGNTLFVAGICWTAAGFTDDEHTVGNFLQKKINKAGIDYNVQVGYYNGKAELLSWLDTAQNLKDNDALLISLDYDNEFIIDLLAPYIPITVIEMSSAFDRPHDYGELFIDCPDHMGAKGQELCAERIFESINSILIDATS